jgi:hypothetical protein
MAEVTSGLTPGARVITAKLDGVKPGSRVRIDAPAAAATVVARAATEG